ncbi:MAG: NADH-quinone oxidoreductase subunit C [Candidatus Aminicenantes bacterium]|nr:NADH-quinone oxidoreductase subunit C [Candidatus Aminicenantes bacterium]
MNDQMVIDKAKTSLGEKVLDIANPAPRRIFIKLKAEDLLDAVGWLKTEMGFTHLATISGVDLGQTFEVLYHFANNFTCVNLRTEIPRDQPRLPSICSLIPGAVLYERELQDMFGITVENIPDGRRLLLPDGWPEGNYPLRKDWKHERPPEVIPGGKK